MTFEVDPRPNSALHCALCRADIGGARAACLDCSVVLHPECAESLAGCPTLGCVRQNERLPVLGVEEPAPRGSLLASLLPLGLVGVLLVSVLTVLSVEPTPPDPSAEPAVELVPAELEAATVSTFTLTLRPGAERDPLRLVVTLTPPDRTYSSSTAQVQVQDEAGAQLADVTFPTGVGVVRDRARVVPYPGREGLELLQLSGPNGSRGHGVYNQHYGWTRDGRLTLARMEVGTGALADVEDGIGPRRPARSAAEWSEILRSGDPVERLEALNLLRWSASKGERAVEKALRDDGQVRALLRELVRGPEPWPAQVACGLLCSWEREELDDLAREAEERVADQDWEGVLKAMAGVEATPQLCEDSYWPGPRSHILGARARAYVRLGRLEAAEQELTGLIGVRGDASAYEQRGRVRLLRGDRAAGMEDLRRAREIRPREPSPSLWLAALTGVEADGTRFVGSESWQRPLYAFLIGASTPERMESEVLAASGSTSRERRMCEVRCLQGVRAERLGQVGDAVRFYEQSLAAGAVSPAHTDWATARLAVLRQR